MVTSGKVRYRFPVNLASALTTAGEITGTGGFAATGWRIVTRHEVNIDSRRRCIAARSGSGDPPPYHH